VPGILWKVLTVALIWVVTGPTTRATDPLTMVISSWVDFIITTILEVIIFTAAASVSGISEESEEREGFGSTHSKGDSIEVASNRGIERIQSLLITLLCKDSRVRPTNF
jgi:hypothetical protein